MICTRDRRELSRKEKNIPLIKAENGRNLAISRSSCPQKTFQTSSSVTQSHWSLRQTDDAARVLAPARPCTHPKRDWPQQQRGLPLLLGEAGSCPAVGEQLLHRRMHADQCGRPIQRLHRRGGRKCKEGRGQQRDPAMKAVSVLTLASISLEYLYIPR